VAHQLSEDAAQTLFEVDRHVDPLVLEHVCDGVEELRVDEAIGQLTVHDERLELVEQLQFLVESDVTGLDAALDVQHVVLELGVADLHDVLGFVGFERELLGVLDRFDLGLDVLVPDDGLDRGVVHVDDQILDLQVLVLDRGREVNELHRLLVVSVLVLDQVRVARFAGENHVLLFVVLFPSLRFLGIIRIGGARILVAALFAFLIRIGVRIGVARSRVILVLVGVVAVVGVSVVVLFGVCMFVFRFVFVPLFVVLILLLEVDYLVALEHDVLLVVLVVFLVFQLLVAFYGET